MRTTVCSADDVTSWRQILANFDQPDPCHGPEYHQAYASMAQNGKALLWHCTDGKDHFCYPFMLGAIMIGDGIAADLYDISSVYGYSGPLSTNDDPAFLALCWGAFDEWSASENIVAEFVRFSPVTGNQGLAHPSCTIAGNRQLAWTDLAALRGADSVEDSLMAALPAKTRNMIRKAQKSGLQFRSFSVGEGLAAFRTLYEKTMQRNAATDFFYYTDQYYDNLAKLPERDCRIFGVYDQDVMVSAAVSLGIGQSALYHLGANDRAYMNTGAGNYALFAMTVGLAKAGFDQLNVTGGRTTSPDDALLRFKRNNSTGQKQYFTGTRVINQDQYDRLAERWETHHGQPRNPDYILFYR